MKTNEEILNNLKEELSKKSETKKENTEEVIETKNEENKITFKKKKKKIKFKKNFSTNFSKEPTEEELKIEKEIEDEKKLDEELLKKEIEDEFYLSEEFLSFKKSVLDNVVDRDFLVNVLPQYRSRGFTDISNDKYLALKMKNKSLKAFVMDASFDEVQNGINGNIYFIKPLYQNEYRDFKLEYEDENLHQTEFLEYTLKHCILYPEDAKNNIEQMPAGRSIAMFHIIKEMSDLNKKFQIIEV